MPGLTTVETVCVDREATGYATFQSHNQKVVSNRNGLFMAYLRSRNEAYTAQQWRLVRSTDGGKHWTTLYEATHATNPPALETDAQGNLYLVRPDFLDGHAYLYRFHAASGYREPLVSRIANGAAGKFALCLDPIRRQLYYFAHNDTFHVVGLDGSVRRSYRILQPGTHAILQYPHLSLDRDGTLYAAWTTQKHGVYLYWDIHYMRSRDGGQSWQKLDGTSLSLPVVADNTGPAEGIIREDEYPVHTWLSSFLVRAGKLHFVYQAWTQPARQLLPALRPGDRAARGGALAGVGWRDDPRGRPRWLPGLIGRRAKRAALRGPQPERADRLPGQPRPRGYLA